MANELEGKVAIVTGGAGGIGKATVELFAAEGARVLIADVNDAAGEALAEQIGAAAVYRHTDVGKKDQVEALVAEAVARFGRLDIMFNNAGISCAAFPDFIDDTFENFHDVVAVNLLGPMVGTQAAARVMIKQGGGGVILNNASIAGLLAGQAVMTYRATKAGLIHFSKSVSIDLARYGIRVNCLVPGHIQTPMSSFEQGSQASNVADLAKRIDAVYLSNQPLKRRGQAEDVAQAALYLASDRARQVTGIAMPVDGGVTTGDPVNHLADIFSARQQVLGD
jgi:NAD(P)-dependent dehydrogenase (short-subunit alcohol dehydrogenase family)